ncbi:MAG: hypothetical protein JXA24_00455 [Proteobacteria bacterium]|nr:hypothetical protein [Pseudomonadota bacterium]
MKARFASQLNLLKELQQIDLNSHKIEQALAALPAKLAAEQSAFDMVRTQLDALKGEKEGIEHARRTDEMELAASTEHLREREAKLYAIKTNKEYQAAIKEITEGKRINREREDRVLAAMERIEALGKEIAQLEGECAEKEGALSKARHAVAEEEAALMQELKAESARRPEIVPQLDKETLRKYEFVRKRYTDALVPVAKEVCSGCSRRLPPQLYNEMLRKECFKVCPNCQRLIYVEEAAVEPEEGGER